jgi:hypothetical protein
MFFPALGKANVASDYLRVTTQERVRLEEELERLICVCIFW